MGTDAAIPNVERSYGSGILKNVRNQAAATALARSRLKSTSQDFWNRPGRRFQPGRTIHSPTTTMVTSAIALAALFGNSHSAAQISPHTVSTAEPKTRSVARCIYIPSNAAKHRRQKAKRRRNDAFWRPNEFALLCHLDKVKAAIFWFLGCPQSPITCNSNFARLAILDNSSIE